MIERFKLHDTLKILHSKKIILPPEKVPFEGIFTGLIFKREKLIDVIRFPNGITNVGKNYLFNAGFNSLTPIAQSAWCMSLIDGATTPTINVTDTMGSHTGWTENTGYTPSTRPTWGPTTSTAQLVANVSLVDFPISVDGTIAGAFITSLSDKGGSTGVLWSTGLFPTAIPVSASVDDIKLIYQLAS